MPFWKKESDEEKLQKARQEERQKATLEALANGQVPPIAAERIARQNASGREFFTSDLSAREYLLCRQSGFKTLGQVMGTSFFNVSFWGFYRSRWTGSGELTNITHAQLEARRLAVTRMQHEAALLGASGIIGVRIKRVSHEWSSRLTEFTAIGTAIKLPGWPEGQEPFTSDLNGQEFWQLYQAGFMPRGIAFGLCSYYVYTDYATQNLIGRSNLLGMNLAPNQEVFTYTQGLYEARQIAMQRFTQDIVNHGAEGAVGVSIDHHVEDIEYEINDYTYHDLLIHFVAMGTTVHESHGQTEHHRAPLMIYDLARPSNSGVDLEMSDYSPKYGDFEEDDDE